MKGATCCIAFLLVCSSSSAGIAYRWNHSGPGIAPQLHAELFVGHSPPIGTINVTATSPSMTKILACRTLLLNRYPNVLDIVGPAPKDVKAARQRLRGRSIVGVLQKEIDRMAPAELAWRPADERVMQAIALGLHHGDKEAGHWRRKVVHCSQNMASESRAAQKRAARLMRWATQRGLGNGLSLAALDMSSAGIESTCLGRKAVANGRITLMETFPPIIRFTDLELDTLGEVFEGVHLPSKIFQKGLSIPELETDRPLIGADKNRAFPRIERTLARMKTVSDVIVRRVGIHEMTEDLLWASAKVATRLFSTIKSYETLISATNYPGAGYLDLPLDPPPT